MEETRLVGKQLDYIHSSFFLPLPQPVCLPPARQQSTVDKLFQKTQTSLLIGTSSWKDQFIEAFKVVADEDDDGEEEGK